MDYERFKEGFQDALKAELAVRGADVELTARRVDKMNESYDAITVRPMDSSIGVNISVEKAFAAYENGTPIPEIAEHFADDHVIIRTKLEKPSKINGLALI